MTAAFATLAFLVSLWLVALVAAQMLEESGSKMLAALKGRSPLAVRPEFRTARVRVSARPRAQRPLRAQPRLLAAA